MVHIINFGTCRDPTVMGLMRCLYFIAAKFNLLLSATHLAGTKNTLADVLSWNNMELFFALHPQAYHSPHPIPLALLDLLVHTKPDWTSPCWSATFNTIFSLPSQGTQCVPMPPATIGTASFAHATASSSFQQMSKLSASSQHSLGNRTSDIRRSSATYQGSALHKSHAHFLIPLSEICQYSTMFCEE